MDAEEEGQELMPQRDLPGRPIWPWVVGGLAAAGALVGGLLWARKARADDSTTDSQSGGSSGGSSSGGKSSSNKKGESTANDDCERCKGKPSDISNNSEGYDTALFPNTDAVRTILEQLGYDVPSSGSLNKSSGVKAFQRDYNTVVRAFDKGYIEELRGAGVQSGVISTPKALDLFRGTLAIDGVPGRNTLRALAIIIHNIDRGNGIPWQQLVQRAGTYK